MCCVFILVGQRGVCLALDQFTMVRFVVIPRSHRSSFHSLGLTPCQHQIKLSLCSRQLQCARRVGLMTMALNPRHLSNHLVILGPETLRTLYIRSTILNLVNYSMGNQCEESRTGLMCSQLPEMLRRHTDIF